MAWTCAAASPAFWVGLAAMFAVIANRLVGGLSHPHPPKRTPGFNPPGDAGARSNGDSKNTTRTHPPGEGFPSVSRDAARVLLEMSECVLLAVARRYCQRQPVTLCPVFPLQSRHAGEFTAVVGDQCQSVGQRRGGDQQVIPANDFAACFQMMSDFGVMRHAA